MPGHAPGLVIPIGRYGRNHSAALFIERQESAGYSTYAAIIPVEARGFRSMPYRENTDLPPTVRTHLPEHAQDIYREAFNHAYAAHAGESDRERRSHMIAWAAVKRGYEKAGGQWVPRDA